MIEQKTALVMLPGLDGTGMVFEPLLKQLPATIEPFVVRYPGDRPMSFPEHIDFTRGRLPHDRPFVLLAESFSGPISLQLLAESPANLIGMVFVATFARYPKPFLLDLARLLPQSGLRKLFATTLLSRFFCLGSADREAVALFQEALASVDLAVLSQRLQILAELPPPPAPNFNGPCLYLRASRDRLVPERAATRLQDHLPQMQRQQIAGPHIILLARPEAGARAISKFIDSLSEQPCKS
jgi:pimeloyl-ACP methyl ester carboxylesterase